VSGVRVLVGTRKGAFVLTSDGKRQEWDVSGPHFAGWEIYHVKGPPADPDRLYASQSSSWSGQVIQRSDDGGQSWEPVDNKFSYDGVPGTHQWYDGTPHPWEFARVWHLEPSLDDPDTVYAGVEDAGLFKSADGGRSWQELAALRGHDSGPSWQPGAGGMCLHTIILDPATPRRMFAAISPARAGRRSTTACSPRASPTPTRKSVTACTASRCTPPARPCCTCKNTGTSCAATTRAAPGTRSAATCQPTSGSPSTCTHQIRTLSTWSRSKAMPSTSRPTESCASTAAAPAETTGSR